MASKETIPELTKIFGITEKLVSMSIRVNNRRCKLQVDVNISNNFEIRTNNQTCQPRRQYITTIFQYFIRRNHSKGYK